MSKKLVEKRKKPGIFLNPANENFRMDRNSKIFVDKTGLLSKMNRMLNTRERFVCVSRPRRFGKTMALNSLIAYYSRSCDSKDLFADLEIGKDESFLEHLNAYDVIRVDMTRFVGLQDSIVEEIQKRVIEEIKDEYQELSFKNDKDLVL